MLGLPSNQTSQSLADAAAAIEKAQREVNEAMSQLQQSPPGLMDSLQQQQQQIANSLNQMSENTPNSQTLNQAKQSAKQAAQQLTQNNVQAAVSSMQSAQNSMKEAQQGQQGKDGNQGKQGQDKVILRSVTSPSNSPRCSRLLNRCWPPNRRPRHQPCNRPLKRWIAPTASFLRSLPAKWASSRPQPNPPCSPLKVL